MWAQREAAFAAREAEHEKAIAHLQSLVAEASTNDAANSEAAPSDLGSVEDLVDDAAWSKVDRGKRKAVLGRQRHQLAKEVRSSLGNLSKVAKVSTASSPFKKA